MKTLHSGGQEKKGEEKYAGLQKRAVSSFSRLRGFLVARRKSWMHKIWVVKGEDESREEGEGRVMGKLKKREDRSDNENEDQGKM